jgi:hypothetical protein
MVLGGTPSLPTGFARFWCLLVRWGSCGAWSFSTGGIVRRLCVRSCVPEAACLFLRATEKSTGCVYALKHFRTDKWFEGEEDLPSPFHEIQLLKSLNHPNIVKVFGAATGSSDADVYMVMEYLESDLRRVEVRATSMGKAPFSLRQVRRSHHTSIFIHFDFCLHGEFVGRFSQAYCYLGHQEMQYLPLSHHQEGTIDGYRSSAKLSTSCCLIA